MIETLIAYAHIVFETLGPWGVLLFAFVQEIIPPIPSTLVTVSAGFVFLAGVPFSVAGFLKLCVFVVLPIAAGLTIGSVCIYYLVQWGGKPIIDRFGRYMGVTWRDIEKIESYMHGRRWDDAVFFAARTFPLIPSVALNVFAGLVRWPLQKFVFYTFTGTMIRSFWSGLIGWQFAHVYERYVPIFDRVQDTIFIVCIAALVVFLFIHKRAQKNETPQ